MLWLLQIFHRLPVRQGIVDFAARALADIAAHVDDIDAVGHVDLALNSFDLKNRGHIQL